MTMKKQTVKTYEKLWAQKFAETYAIKNKYCGCPIGSLLRKTGNLSEILNLLPSNPKRTFLENLGELVELSVNINVRKKVKNVLEIQNFDINPQSIVPLENYWTEDIQLLKTLHESDILSYKDIYDELETCIDPSLNNECCESLEVYYETADMEYTYTSIYGFYV